jgi:hypothetical protein
MLECNRQVRELLDGLVREAAHLEVAPLSTDIEDPAAEWDREGKGWEARWRAADARCRFSQLADQGLGTAYDRMAWVHRSLPRTRLKFTERMARFSDDLAEEVGEMRRALDKSQAALPAAGQGNRP